MPKIFSKKYVYLNFLKKKKGVGDAHRAATKSKQLSDH